jgi:hypothetical protein
MKKLYQRIILTIGFVFLFAGGVSAQSALQDVSDGVRTGNVDAISAYFDNMVPLTINNNQGAYSKQQAEMVLKDFFSRNTPKEFMVANSGSSNGAKFVIGDMTTTAGLKYSVYILLKEKEHVYYLQELRLNK